MRRGLGKRLGGILNDQDDNKLILYMGGFELPDKNAAAQRVLSNAKAFRELGYKIVFLGISHSLESPSKIKDTFKEYEGFDTYAIPYPKTLIEWFSYISSAKSFRDISLLYREKIGCSIFYNYPALSLHRISKICRKQKIKTVADCTEWYSGKGRKDKLGLVKFIDSEFRMRFFHKRMNAVIAISQYLTTYYINNVPTFYVPPLVDKNEEKWLTLNNEKSSIFTIVYAGSPGKKDRIDLLIAAVLECDFDIVVKVIGITKQEFISLYPDFKDIDISKISFFGRLSHLEALNQVKKADYTCFFREHNRVSQAGFPTKFVESISAGVPVITNNTSDIGNISSLVGGCLIVDTISISSIKNAIVRAYNKNLTVPNPDYFDYNNLLDTFRVLIEEVFS